MKAADVCLSKWSNRAVVDASRISSIVEAIAMRVSFHQSLPVNDDPTIDANTRDGVKMCRTVLDNAPVSVLVNFRKTNPNPMMMKIGKIMVSRICTIMLKKSN